MKWSGWSEIVPLLENVPEETEAGYRLYFDLMHNITKTAKMKISLPFVIPWLSSRPG